MMTEIAVQIEDGWYPDPSDPAQLRWWADGGWTSETTSAADMRAEPLQPAEAVDAEAGDPSSAPPIPRSDDTTAAAGRSWRASRRVGLSLAAGALVIVGLSAAAVMSPWPEQTGATHTKLIDAPAARPAADDEVQPDQKEEPDPPEELELIEFRETDPLDLPWRTTCNDEFEDQAVNLVALGDSRLVSSGQTPPEPTYEVMLDSVVFGDVTGDGREDAVFQTFCLQNATVQWIEVWTHDVSGEPIQLEPIVGFTKFDGAIERHEVVDSHVRIHWSTGVPWDQYPHLNGYPVQVVTDHAWSDRVWVSTEVSRHPESFEGCEDPSSSAEAAARCFVESVQRGRWEVAASVADAATIEWLREGDLGAVGETFTGCGPARLPQPPDRVACFVESPDGAFAQLDVNLAVSGYLVDGIFYGSGGVEDLAGTYGANPYFDELWDSCASGVWADCSQLYLVTPIGSDYEWFGSTCGGREPFGTCDFYTDW